jgi:hypothetical protein
VSLCSGESNVDARTYRHLVHIYALDARPDVEVLVDGTWYPGEARGYWDGDDGQAIIDVQWRSAPGQARIDGFPAERVRSA